MPNSNRENPSQKQPYTVLCVIVSEACMLVSHTWGYDANDAVEQSLNTHASGQHYHSRGEIEIIGVFYGHIEFCKLEDDYRFTMFQFPILEEK